MPSARNVIAGLPSLADQAARLTPRALRRLVALEDDVDGYPTRGEGGGSRSTSESTPVERAAAQLLPLSRDREAILRAVDDAHHALHRAIGLASKYLDKIDTATMRCTGGASLDGALDWGRPDCDNISEPDRKGGLCSRCRHARERWQRERAQAA